MSTHIAAEPRLRLRDNPLLIAQVRRHCRRRQTIPGVAVAVILGLLGLFAGAVVPTHRNDAVWLVIEMGYVGLAAVVLLLRGTLTVTGTIAEERASGLLDFHRATPTSPWTDALGYLLGTPSREYLLAAVLVPFALVAAVASGGSPLRPVAAVFALVVNGWLYHSLGAVMGFTATRRRQAVGAVVVLLVLLLFGTSAVFEAGIYPVASLTPYPALRALYMPAFAAELLPSVEFSFFGVTMPALLYAVLLQGYLIAFLAWAVARKLRADAAPVFSKPGAVVFYALGLALVLGGLTEVTERAGVGTSAALLVGYGVAGTLLAAVVTAVVVPDYLAHVRAVRRARRFDRRWPSWREDGARPWLLVPAMVGLFVGGWALLVLGLPGGDAARLLTSVEASAVYVAMAVLLVFAVAATEFARFCLRRSKRSGAFLLVFLTVFVPYILAAIFGGAGFRGESAAYIAALSPTYALGVALARLSPEVASSFGPGTLVVSLAVGVGLAVLFLARVRAAIAAAD